MTLARRWCEHCCVRRVDWWLGGYWVCEPCGKVGYPPKRHPQAPALHPSGTLIQVDVLLLPLLERMWVSGLQTGSSCQGEGWGIINIATRSAAQLAVDLIRQRQPGFPGYAWESEASSSLLFPQEWIARMCDAFSGTPTIRTLASVRPPK